MGMRPEGHLLPASHLDTGPAARVRRDDDGEVGEVVGVGEAGNTGMPAGRGHRHSQVVQSRAATDGSLPAGAVGGMRYPRRIEEQSQFGALGDPKPRLAVVHRRCAAGRFHGIRHHPGIDHRLGHGRNTAFAVWFQR